MSFNNLLVLKLLSNKYPMGKLKKYNDISYDNTLLALKILFFLVQQDGTELFQFVDGYSSWDAYLIT